MLANSLLKIINLFLNGKYVLYYRKRERKKNNAKNSYFYDYNNNLN